MLLKEFSFKDKCTGWELSPTYFDPLTLLVGPSGVGKTKILEAISILPGLASGKSYNGVRWRAFFTDEMLGNIVWEGETECVEGKFDNRQRPFHARALNQDSIADGFPFSFEKISLNGEELFSRAQKETKYKGKETVKLQGAKSLVSVLQEEDVFRIMESVLKIETSVDRMGIMVMGKVVSEYEKKNDFSDLINEETIPFATKLFICSVKFIDVFESIKRDFIEIFPFVEDVRFLFSEILLSSRRFNDDPSEMQTLHLKERGSDVWVPIWDFSSGMKKVLSLLAAIRLSPDGSVFIIDEFENSFGENCIDEIAKKIIEESARIQFLLSSHHPKIINVIGSDCWRLVNRRGCTVSSRKVIDELSGKSKHEKFTQLINLDGFSDGIE